MKRILNFLLIAILTITVLGSCTKGDYYNEWDSYSNKEYGIVTYTSPTSPYFVMQMDKDGKFGVMYSIDVDKKTWPIYNDVVYGDFSIGGSRKVYNKTYGKSTLIEVDDFFSYESDAINSIKRKETTASFNKTLITIQRRNPGEIAIPK